MVETASFIDTRQILSDSQLDRDLSFAEEVDDLDPQVFASIEGQRAPEVFAEHYKIPLDKFTDALAQPQGLSLHDVVKTLEAYERENPQFCAAVTGLIKFRRVEKQKAYEPLIQAVRNHGVDQDKSFLEMIRAFNAELVLRYLKTHEHSGGSESKHIAHIREKAKEFHFQDSARFPNPNYYTYARLTIDAMPFSLEEVLGIHTRTSIAQLLDIKEVGSKREKDIVPRLHNKAAGLTLTPPDHQRDLGESPIAIYDAGVTRYKTVESGVRVLHTTICWLLNDRNDTGYLFSLSDLESSTPKEARSLTLTPYSRSMGKNNRRSLCVSGASTQFSHLQPLLEFVQSHVK